MSYLLPHEALWYEIGLRFGVKVETLDEIKQVYAKPKSCLRRIVTALLALPEGEVPASSPEARHGSVTTNDNGEL